MSLPDARPLYFGPPKKRLFGWLHVPQSAPSMGLVLCNSFGNEAVCLHRTYRHCARMAAEAGFPALRFDYYGSGDSAGNWTDPAQLRAWIDSVCHAVGTLCETTGVRQVCLLGTRLGATIAMLAAEELEEVAALVAVAPVISGRTYLRELRALALASPLRRDAATDGNIGETLEAAGFALSAETQAELAKIDVLQRGPAHYRQACLFYRDDLPVKDALRESLQRLGVEVSQQRFSGYTNMMLDPHDAVVPHHLLTDIVSWLQDHSTALAATEPAAASHKLCAHGVVSPGIEEYAGFLDDSQRIFGVTTEAQLGPDANPSSHRQVLVLVNSGSVHHIGPNRLYVTLARALAVQGVTVLRFDLAGLGDSVIQTQTENAPYPERALDDIAQAVAFIHSRFGPSDVHLAGICSGGYHSLKAALNGTPLRSVTVINPLTFFWKSGMSLAQPEYRATAEMNRYRRRLFQPEAWLKLVRGQVHVVAAARLTLKRLASRASHWKRNVARRLRISVNDDLAAELIQIAARGIRMQFVFSGADPGLTLLREQSGSVTRHLARAGALEIDIIQGADHTFTPAWGREKLLLLLSAQLARHREN